MPRPLSYRKEINNMSVPYVPTADFSIYSDDPETLAKAEINGLYLGVSESSPYTYTHTAIMAWITPKNIHPKIFFQKVTNTSYNIYVCSNIVLNDSSAYYILHGVSTSGEEGYGLYTHSITTPFTTGGTTIYYGSLGNIPSDNLNSYIPVYDTLSEGLTAANNEGWAYVDPTNPYEFDPESISYAGGGNGKFDNTSDTVGVPSLPTLSAVSAGFVTMFTPTIGQLNTLANFLWTDSAFDPANFKKLFTDPMECIIGLTIVPLAPSISGTSEIKVGYVGTGVSASKLSSQYAELSCGTIQADEFWGSALDYSPYTKLHIYLPYIGMREINADEIMGRTIGVTYHVDLLSGACTAFVTANGSVLYQFNGQCSINIPMAASNFTEMIHSAVTAIGTVAATVSPGSAAAAATGGAMLAGAVQMGANAANAAMGSKPTFQHSGQMGGSGGMLAVQTPYLIIERPRQSMPEGLNKFVGYPSNINYKLYDMSGYTVIDSIHLDGIPATDTELSEIESLLKGGVIL